MRENFPKRVIQQFGNTWWGQQWLRALTQIDYDNRLPRGRSYARGGAVTELKNTARGVQAYVRGSRRSPYRVELSLMPFTAEERRRVIRTVAANPFFLVQLMSRQLPEKLNEALVRDGVNVFPRSVSDLSAACSCPDYAMPCKHIAAVVFLVANEIDRDPFRVFELRGMNLPAELATRWTQTDQPDAVPPVAISLR